MNLLAIDTCFAACSAAVGLGIGAAGANVTSRFEPMGKGHAERLFPMIDEVMREAAVTYADLGGLAVTVGPGSFTGTRVGVAAVRALCLATGLPVYGATSLAAIGARAVRQTPSIGVLQDTPLFVCHDARRGQLYTQMFSALQSAPVGPPQVVSVEQVLDGIVGPRLAVAGSGASYVIDAASNLDVEVIAMDGDGLPDAQALLEVHLDALDPPRPLYLRPPDAKPQAAAGIARRAGGSEMADVK